MLSRTLAGIFLAAASVLSLSTPALAQEPADTLVVPLEGVVITGTRMPESALRTPAAITVVDRSAYAKARDLSLKDALGSVPGVFVQSRAGAQDVRITIRGFGARGNGERSNAGNMRGIRVMTDGVPVTEPDGRTALDLVDLGSADRIEVVRSNSSTLYGNASGGVVNLRTNLEFESPYLEARERAGSFGFHREQGLVGFTAGGARGVVSLLNSTLEGWRAHSGSTVALVGGRLAIPLDSKTRLGLLLDAVSDLNRFPGALTQAQLDSAPRQANPRFVQRDERRANRIGRVAGSLDRTIGEDQDLSLSLFVEPKSLLRSERGRFRDFTRYHLGGSGTWLLRAQLSPGLESRTLLGGDEAYQDGAILFYGLAPDGSRGTNLVANKREGANSAGGFVQEELRWNERWALRVAGRYDHLRYVSEDHVDPSLDARKVFTHWTPKGSLAYFFDRQTLYAALGGGVEAPAFNEIDPPPPLDTLTSLNPFLEPMRSTTWEAGARGELGMLATGPLTYDLALFRIEVRNDIVPFNGGAYFFTAGRSRRQGAEVGLGWRPIEPLSVRGELTLMDSEYLEYKNDLGDFGGRRVPGLPRVHAGGALGWKAPAGISADLSAEHAGDYFANDANTARAPAYTLLGAALGIERAIGVGTVSAFVAGENLTDESYVASVFINGINGEFYEPGLPRNWSAGVSLRWK